MWNLSFCGGSAEVGHITKPSLTNTKPFLTNLYTLLWERSRPGILPTLPVSLEEPWELVQQSLMQEVLESCVFHCDFQHWCLEHCLLYEMHCYTNFCHDVAQSLNMMSLELLITCHYWKFHFFLDFLYILLAILHWLNTNVFHHGGEGYKKCKHNRKINASRLFSKITGKDKHISSLLKSFHVFHPSACFYWEPLWSPHFANQQSPNQPTWDESNPSSLPSPSALSGLHHLFTRRYAQVQRNITCNC